MLGDSYVWGFGVQEDDMFTSRMEKQIPNLEIVNLGVSGYSTDQELLLYEDEGRKYKADLAVIVVAVNDFEGNMLTAQSHVYGNQHSCFRLTEILPSLINLLSKLLRLNARLYDWPLILMC